MRYPIGYKKRLSAGQIKVMRIVLAKLDWKLGYKKRKDGMLPRPSDAKQWFLNAIDQLIDMGYLERIEPPPYTGILSVTMKFKLSHHTEYIS